MFYGLFVFFGGGFKFGWSELLTLSWESGEIVESFPVALFWFICLTVYQQLTGYFMPRFDSFVYFDLVYLFNDISTLYGLFNAKIWFICLVWFGLFI